MNITLYNAAKSIYLSNGLEYHNWQHITAVSNARQKLFEKPASAELETAILFHDAIYVPGAPVGYNETLSAYKLENVIIALDLHLDLDLPRAKNLIIGTATDNYTNDSFVPNNQELAELMDCDISSFGDLDYSKFETLQDYIIEEFVGSLKQYKEDKIAFFRKRRANFLAGVASKRHIYQTDECRVKLEKTAFYNLGRYCVQYG